jgi:competence protein ComEA
MDWSVLALAICLFASAPQVPALQKSTAAAGAKVPVVVVNLNTATLADLQELPGIGEKTAERIIEYREKNGPFKKIEELMNVRGIGEKAFLKLRSQLTVTGKATSSPPQD